MATNYEARFSEALPEAKRLVVDHGNDIRAIIPRFYGVDFDRLTNSIASMLERVDKGKIDHPEFLAHSSGNIADYAITLIEGVPSSIESGASHFVQTTLPALLLSENRLLATVGHYHFQVRDIKERQLKEIQKLVSEALEFRNQAFNAQKEASAGVEAISTAASGALASKNEVTSAVKAVADIRAAVTKLASGDARNKSLDSLKRLAESKVDEIDSYLKRSNILLTNAAKAAESADNAASKTDEMITTISEISRQATAVLQLSSQAGLATSYLNESAKLEWRSNVFTGILYSAAVAAALIAAFMSCRV